MNDKTKKSTTEKTSTERELVDGQVRIELNGKPVNLKCTPKAIFTLNDLYGGVVPLLQALGKADMTALLQVIRYGANLQDMENEVLQDLVFQNSNKLFSPAVEYVQMFLNGGRRTPLLGQDEGN